VESIQELDIIMVKNFYESKGEEEGLIIFRETKHAIEFDIIEDLQRDIRKVWIYV
jgi:hypothetical protein